MATRAPLVAVAVALAGCLATPEPLAAGEPLVAHGFALHPPGGVLAPGATLEVRALLTNQGREVEEARAVLLVDGAEAGPGRELRVWPGDTEEVKVYWKPPRDGAYLLELRFSHGASFPADVLVGAPRVAIERMGVFPSEAEVGDPVSVFAELRNTGTAPTFTTATVLLDGEPVGEGRAWTLSPGLTEAFSYTFVPAKKGTLGVGLVLSDGPGASAPLRVKAPDLRLRAWNVDKAACDPELRVTVVVENAGDGIARDVRVAVTARGSPGSTPDEGGDAVRDLGAGEQGEAHVALGIRDTCPGEDPYTLTFRLTARHANPFEWTSPVQYA